MIDPIYLLLTGAVMLASRLVSATMQRRFARFAQTPLDLTGREVAEMMLRQNGVEDVEVTAVRGQLTDHYNPKDRTVNLSEPVYSQRNVSAAAVAAHECGHALQHATGYSMLRLRSGLVPLVSMSTKVQQIVLMIGLGLAFSGQPLVLWIGIAMFSLTTLFTLVTLPVEFNASRRALGWLENARITLPEQHSQAKKALFWAAMTYVVAALGSIGQLLYFVMIALRAQGRRRSRY